MRVVSAGSRVVGLGPLFASGGWPGAGCPAFGVGRLLGCEVRVRVWPVGVRVVSAGFRRHCLPGGSAARAGGAVVVVRAGVRGRRSASGAGAGPRVRPAGVRVVSTGGRGANPGVTGPAVSRCLRR
ncbi:hypothetical protein GCM10010294_12740 [Streptomyces griseoloalbus]|nr:hypothetical protein GCM10010294_12740 [Streptomyces griseoloalbus]